MHEFKNEILSVVCLIKKKVHTQLYIERTDFLSLRSGVRWAVIGIHELQWSLKYSCSHFSCKCCRISCLFHSLVSISVSLLILSAKVYRRKILEANYV